MNIAKFSVKNPVLVNMLMIGLFAFGAISFMQLPRELNPNVDFNWIFITVVYPGAAPSETE
jgi:multidrug efflux pump subunit AcrB